MRVDCLHSPRVCPNLLEFGSQIAHFPTVIEVSVRGPIASDVRIWYRLSMSIDDDSANVTVGSRQQRIKRIAKNADKDRA